MAKAVSAGRSALSGVIILFVIITGMALVISNEFIFSYFQDKPGLSPLLLGIALFFLVLLLVLLCIQIWRIFRGWRNRETGIRYKVKLVAYFSLVVFLAALPSVALTSNILRKAFDLWFVEDTNQALAFGKDSTLDYYRFRLESFGSFLNSDSLPGLMRNYLRNNDAGYRRMRALNPVLDAIQVFDQSGSELAASGNPALRVTWEEAGRMEAGRALRSGQDSLVLRLPLDLDDGQTGVAVFQSYLGKGFDAGARLLGSTEARLREYRDFGLSFPLIIFGVYLLLLVPLLILAILMALYLADRLVGPLGQLDEAVQKVANGDFTTRLLAKESDVFYSFIGSFNRMVEEIEGSRMVIIQSERLSTWQEIAQRLAHEIKNPLTPIQLAAERIRRKHASGSEGFAQVMEECVAIIVHEVGGLSRMLAEFRDFARLPAPVRQPVNLAEMVYHVWNMYRDASGLELDDTFLPKDMQLDVDQGQMLQVLKNLFQNAVDAMPDGGKIRVAAFNLEKGGQHLARVVVSDTGTGMDPQTLAQVFSPYFTSKPGGTGLGLAICEKIMLDHGGQIRAESTPGKGSSFFLDFYQSRPPAKEKPNG